MDCKQEEALRAMEIAEKKMESKEFTGARKFALKAQQLYPDLENIDQMLIVCNVLCSAEQRLFRNEMDCYKILQVELTADDATIKKQYRKFALQLHPDKNKFAGAEAAFKLIGEAQRVLLDRVKRSAHDMNRVVAMNNTAMPSHLQQKVQMNFHSQTNVRPNFSNLKPQQQSRQPAQEGLNGCSPTFSTVCPFCSVKYQYSRELLYRSLRCQHCDRPFIAYDVDVQGTTPATNSCQQAFAQQKYGLSHGAFKVNVGSQGDLHAYKSDGFRKPNGNGRTKLVAESGEGFISVGNTDSEEDMFASTDGFPGVKNYSHYREELQRRSTQKKHQFSYKKNVNDEGGDLLRPSKRGKGSVSPCVGGENNGDAGEMNYQDGLAADLIDDQKEVSLKQRFYSAVNLVRQNVGAQEVRGSTVGGATFKSTNHPDVFVCPDPEFSDFERDKKEECFAKGQIWAIYDTTDSMPRFYALIRKVFNPGFKLRITWLEPYSDDKNEINWLNEKLPVACGKYRFGSTESTEDHLMFSHLIYCEKIGRCTYKIYPKRGETWALFKNWDIKWYMNVESNQQYEFEFVEILSDYVEGEGVFVAYLSKLKGFVCLFFQIAKENNHSFLIPPVQLFRFSHRIPSFRMTGEERVGVPIGSYELDPASLPVNLKEIAVPEDLEAKVGCGPPVGTSKMFSDMEKSPTARDGYISAFPANMETSNLAEENKGSVHHVCIDLEDENSELSVRSSDRLKLMTKSEDVMSTSNVNLERNNLAEENKGSVYHIDDCSAPSASTTEAIVIPDPQFFNFDAGRSLEKFQVGQIWAFYSDEDGMPKYYGLIKRIGTGPGLELHVTWLKCCRLPENATRWEDKNMVISCGRFVINESNVRGLYANTNSISHRVHAFVDDKNKEYVIFPRRGEIWALYRKWTTKIKRSDLKNLKYEIVEVLRVNDMWINVLLLESVVGFNSVFKGQLNEGSTITMKIPTTEVLRFSHQIPAFKFTEEHGNLSGFWELDPGALPIHHFSSK